MTDHIFEKVSLLPMCSKVLTVLMILTIGIRHLITKSLLMSTPLERLVDVLWVQPALYNISLLHKLMEI